MKKDHALTYQDRSLRNWPHRRRLAEIRSVIRGEGLDRKPNQRYADIGCGTGYITGIVAEALGAVEVAGYDHYPEHLEIARKKYPSFRFERIDLNRPAEIGRYDIVTCFETIEHVGDVRAALKNLLRATGEGGTLIVTVPIEIGAIGVIKFLAKTLLYGYALDELPGGGGASFYRRYLLALLARRDTGAFRDVRPGWGTHFGFDFRAVDAFFESEKVRFGTKNVLTTRFYVVKP